MSSTIRKLLARRALVLVLVLGVALLLVGGTYALAGHSGKAPKGPKVEASEKPSPEPSESPDAEGTPGGSVVRFHDAVVCNLTDVSKLSGNWTHGDYVSAVAKTDPSKAKDAAKSDCGKPMSAVGPHGKSDQSHGKSDLPHGKSDEPHGKNAH